MAVADKCEISQPSTATTSATSLVVMDTISYSYIPNASSSNDIDAHFTDEPPREKSFKNLKSESYKQAIDNNLWEPNEIGDNKYIASLGVNKSGQANTLKTNINNQNLAYKRQEANFYVQQILTNLLALGVLEFESGFENAINKTFKVRCFYLETVWVLRRWCAIFIFKELPVGHFRKVKLQNQLENKPVWRIFSPINRNIFYIKLFFTILF